MKLDRRLSFKSHHATSNERAIAPLARRADSSGGTSNILIAGIVILGICVVILAVGGVWYYLKKTRQSDEDDEATNSEKPAPRTGFSRANITPSIILPVSSRPVRPDYTMQNKRPMTEAESVIAEHHRANNELPAAFAAFVVSDEGDEYPLGEQPIISPADLSAMLSNTSDSSRGGMHRPGKDSVSSSYTLTVSAGRTGGDRNSRASWASGVPSPLSASFGRRASNLSYSTTTFDGPSAPMAASPDRNATAKNIASRPGTGNSTSHTFGSSDRLSTFKFPAARFEHGRSASVASSRSAMIFAKNALSAMRKKALQSFEPLLPDELPVSVGDTLSLLQQFDDGWCVVAVEQDGEAAADSDRVPSGSKEVKMGCVPLWVFERKSKAPGGHARTMRTISLAVTVELTPTDAGVGLDGAPRAPWQREQPTVSWSNF